MLVTGKTGAGKSTLINAMPRKEIAVNEIGRPVTENTRCYEDDEMPLRIYDTKGLELSANALEKTKNVFCRYPFAAFYEKDNLANMHNLI